MDLRVWCDEGDKPVANLSKAYISASGTSCYSTVYKCAEAPHHESTLLIRRIPWAIVCSANGSASPRAPTTGSALPKGSPVKCRSRRGGGRPPIDWNICACRGHIVASGQALATLSKQNSRGSCLHLPPVACAVRFRGTSEIPSPWIPPRGNKRFEARGHTRLEQNEPSGGVYPQSNTSAAEKSRPLYILPFRFCIFEPLVFHAILRREGTTSGRWRRKRGRAALLPGLIARSNCCFRKRGNRCYCTFLWSHPAWGQNATPTTVVHQGGRLGSQPCASRPSKRAHGRFRDFSFSVCSCWEESKRVHSIRTISRACPSERNTHTRSTRPGQPRQLGTTPLHTTSLGGLIRLSPQKTPNQNAC